MTLAKERAKKAVKTKRLPKSLQHRERLLDSIDLVQRLNAAAAARRGMAHARNIGIESERLATRAKGPAVEGLASIGRAMQEGERQMAADFAAAARGTPRPRSTPMGMTPGDMTRPPPTPNLPPLIPPTPAGRPPPPGPAPQPTPRMRRRRGSAPPTPNPTRAAAMSALQASGAGREFLGFARAAGV